VGVVSFLYPISQLVSSVRQRPGRKVFRAIVLKEETEKALYPKNAMKKQSSKNTISF